MSDVISFWYNVCSTLTRHCASTRHSASTRHGALTHHHALSSPYTDYDELF